MCLCVSKRRFANASGSLFSRDSSLVCNLMLLKVILVPTFCGLYDCSFSIANIKAVLVYSSSEVSLLDREVAGKGGNLPINALPCLFIKIIKAKRS